MVKKMIGKSLFEGSGKVILIIEIFLNNNKKVEIRDTSIKKHN